MTAVTRPRFDVRRIRGDFPILQRTVRGKPLVYLDNAATAHKPTPVIEAVSRFYGEINSNVHRGVHWLSEQATREYEGAREKVARWIGAASASEIVFTRGTTEAINLVAHSYGAARVGAGDDVVISWMEHHSNIVPWQMLCERAGARLHVVPIDDAGRLDLDAFRRMLGGRTRLVAITHVSNALGTVNPVREIVEASHRAGIPVLLDGAQAVPHGPVDVRALGCDFYAFSSHKLFGPTGVGVLYGKSAFLEAMPPWQGGGDMIRSVTFEKTEYSPPPHRFEAGTPDIAGAIGLGAAIDWLGEVDWEGARSHEASLLAHATEALLAVPGLRIVGTAPEKAAVVSFVLEGVHPHDVGTILDQEGIAIRTGHHCAQPVMDRYGLPATARASFALYNTHEEVEALARALRRVLEVFR